MIPEVGGTRPWGPRGNGSPSVSKGPKPPIQLLKLLKNSQREVKGPIFVIYWVPPGPNQELEFVGSGGKGPSRSPPPPVSPAMIFPTQEAAALPLHYLCTISASPAPPPPPLWRSSLQPRPANGSHQSVCRTGPRHRTQPPAALTALTARRRHSAAFGGAAAAVCRRHRLLFGRIPDVSGRQPGGAAQ